jgi:hypothetical protein
MTLSFFPQPDFLGSADQRRRIAQTKKRPTLSKIERLSLLFQHGNGNIPGYGLLHPMRKTVVCAALKHLQSLRR